MIQLLFKHPLSLFLKDEQSGDLLVKASSSSQKHRERFKKEEGLAGHVLQIGESLIIPDVSKHPSFIKGITTDITERSMLLSPLKLKHQIIGIISADFHGLNGFDDEDRKLMDIFSQQVSIAIHNMKLFESERKLSNISQIIDITADQGEICNQIFDELYHIVKYDSSSIQLIQGNLRKLIAYRSGRYHQKTFHPKLHRSISEDPLIFKIVENKEIIMLSNVEETLLWERIPETSHINSWMGVPLIVKGNVIGLMTLDHSEIGYYTEEHKNEVFSFANRIASELLKNDLYIKEKEKMQLFDQLYDVSNDILSIKGLSDIRSTLKTIAEKAKELLNADLIELYEYRNEYDGYILPHITAGEHYVKSVSKEKIYNDDAVFNLIKEPSPIYIKDAKTKKELTSRYTIPRDEQPNERFVDREKIESVAIIPLRIANENKGLMFANYRSPQSFSEEKQRLIELFANQISIAIKNAVLYDKINTQRKILIGIARILTNRIYTNEEQVYKLIYEQAISKLGAKNISIALYDKAEAKAQFVIASVNRNLLDVNNDSNLTNRMAGKTEFVIHKRKPYLISSITELKNTRFYKEKHKSYLHYSWLGVPIIVRDEVFGVIANYDYDRDNAFNEDDITILQALADLAAIAIENSRLHSTEIENERKLLRTLIDNMPDHIYIKDSKSRFILANNRVAEFMGVNSWRELIGKTDHDFFPKDLADEYLTDEERIINSLEPMINKEERSQLLRTNECIWLSTTKRVFEK